MPQNPSQFLPEPHPIADKHGMVTRPWLMFFQNLVKILVSVGSVFGPGSSTDSTIALFDGTTGTLLKEATGSGVVTVTNGVYGTLQLAASRLLGRGSAGGTGTPESIDLGTGLQMTGTTLELSGGSTTRAITLGIDGGGATITTGIKADVYVPYNATITAVTMLADQSGSIVVDIWKDTYANYPPTVADTITASAKPTISTATQSQDTTLTGWTTSIAAGDTLRFNVDSVTSIQRLALTLTVTV
jgi:hypothetical protein